MRGGTVNVPAGCYSDSTMKPVASQKSARAVQLTWSHFGGLYRVTAWPEVSFESQQDGRWVSFEPDPASEIFAAAALVLSRADWNRYLEFVPPRERAFLEKFRFGRLAALAVITRCPALLSDLESTPILTSFVAAHVVLRGGNRPAWAEIAAVEERMGLYGVMEWLGLPASPLTLEALGHIADVELAKRLLEPLRETLWNPVGTGALGRAESISERDLAATCAALAA